MVGVALYDGQSAFSKFATDAKKGVEADPFGAGQKTSKSNPSDCQVEVACAFGILRVQHKCDIQEANQRRGIWLSLNSVSRRSFRKHSF